MQAVMIKYTSDHIIFHKVLYYTSLYHTDFHLF